MSSSGLLNKHYEKLMQCDPRLKSLSESPVPSGNSLYIEHQTVKVEGQHHFQHHVHQEMHSIGQYTVPGSKCSPSFSSFQPLSRSTALLGDIVELDNLMTKWAPKVSFPPTVQCHDVGLSADRREVYCLKSGGTNFVRTATPGIVDHGLPASMVFRPSLETENHSESHSSNWKKLDEVSRILLEEPYGHLPMSAGSAVLSSL